MSYPGASSSTNQRPEDIVKVWPRSQDAEDPEYGPCTKGGFHRVRWHSTTSSLLLSLLVCPYICGYRGKKVLVCTKCDAKMSGAHHQTGAFPPPQTGGQGYMPPQGPYQISPNYGPDKGYYPTPQPNQPQGYNYPPQEQYQNSPNYGPDKGHYPAPQPDQHQSYNYPPQEQYQNSPNYGPDKVYYPPPQPNQPQGYDYPPQQEYPQEKKTAPHSNDAQYPPQPSVPGMYYEQGQN